MRAASILLAVLLCGVLWAGAVHAQNDTERSRKKARAAQTQKQKVDPPAAKERSKKLRASKTAVRAKEESRAAASTRVLAPVARARDGEAEGRLLEVYRLIGAADYREALAKSETLAQLFPHFQLAHLVHGDLLGFFAGPRAPAAPVSPPDVVTANKPVATTISLADLRAESTQRLRALRERPPAGTVPSQFVGLSKHNRHAIAVDASRSRLYLFENGEQGLRLVADYYMSVGKAGVEKSAEGDLRTPLGVYYITGLLGPKSLKAFYGSGALPINYPNPLDLSRGKTGGGIWLHGTPPNQFARAPLASDGCVVLSNPDLERIIRTVEARSTPVVIAPQLKWVDPTNLKAENHNFESALEGWRVAKSNGDLQRLLNFYADDFQGKDATRAGLIASLLSSTAAAQGRAVQLKDLSMLRWSDTADTMVVTFGEVLEGKRTGVVKRQYWARRRTEWKIFFEGVIG